MTTCVGGTLVVRRGLVLRRSRYYADAKDSLAGPEIKIEDAESNQNTQMNKLQKRQEAYQQIPLWLNNVPVASKRYSELWKLRGGKRSMWEMKEEVVDNRKPMHTVTESIANILSDENKLAHLCETFEADELYGGSGNKNYHLTTLVMKIYNAGLKLYCLIEPTNAYGIKGDISWSFTPIKAKRNADTVMKQITKQIQLLRNREKVIDADDRKHVSLDMWKLRGG